MRRIFHREATLIKRVTLVMGEGDKKRGGGTDQKEMAN